MHHGCFSLRLGICQAGTSGVISSSRIDEPLAGSNTATRCILAYAVVRVRVDDFKFYLYSVFEFVVIIIIGNGRRYIRLANRLVKIATHILYRLGFSYYCAKITMLHTRLLIIYMYTAY